MGGGRIERLPADREPFVAAGWPPLPRRAPDDAAADGDPVDTDASAAAEITPLPALLATVSDTDPTCAPDTLAAA